jgi:hypothetical protein
MRRILLISGAGLVAACIALWFSWGYALDAQRGAAIRSCVQTDLVSKQIECLFLVIEKQMSSRGVQAALAAFEDAYEASDGFGSGRCHSYAHQVGDIGYYSLYVGSSYESLEEVDFPPGVTACGYGYITGFLTHYFQDNPRVDDIVATCSYIVGRLAPIDYSAAGCYHAAGHGFTHALEDALAPSDFGNLSVLDGPLSSCESLPVSEVNISQCRQAVYQQFIEWATLSQYGFSFNQDSPFLFCENEAPQRQRDCSIQVAIRLYVWKNALEPDLDLDSFITAVRDEELRVVLRHIAIEGKTVLRVMECSGVTKEHFWEPTCSQVPFLP